MEDTCARTPYFFDFTEYYKRAMTLNLRNIGKLPADTLTGDPLQDNVTIYDTVWRRYAGFSKVLEQLWYGPESWTPIKSDIAYKRILSIEDWLYVCLVHRLTGSGASFEKDHGYRNTLLIEMVENRYGLGNWTKFIKEYDKPFFTSKGNQIPPFNKPTDGWDKGGRQFIVNDAPILVNYMVHKMKNRARPLTIQEGVDIVLDWMTENGFKRYKFVLTAWVMDIAEYYPGYVDQNSHCYMGKNAYRAIDLMFDCPHKVYDQHLDYLCEIYNNKPYNIEDVLCDAIRYWNNYIPKNYTEHYESLSTAERISLN